MWHYPGSLKSFFVETSRKHWNGYRVLGCPPDIGERLIRQGKGPNLWETFRITGYTLRGYVAVLFSLIEAKCVLSDNCTIAPEFELLCALNGCRAELIRRISEFAQERLEGIPEDQRYIDNKYNCIDFVIKPESLHFAEWLFSIQAIGLKHGDRMRLYLEQHNKSMEDIINIIRNSPGKRCDITNITLETAKSSIFPKSVINRIVIYKDISSGSIGFSQSDVARIHVEVASAETWRLVLLALERSGFISRLDIGPQLIQTNGVLECFVRDYLKDVATETSSIKG